MLELKKRHEKLEKNRLLVMLNEMVSWDIFEKYWE